MKILSSLVTASSLICGMAFAEVPPPPIIQDATVQQNQYFKDLYENQNLPPTVKVNPNGNRYGNYGQIVRYFDGTSYTLYTCVSSPNGKSWQIISDPSCHGLPTGGTASQALVKVSGTDYDVTWATQESHVYSLFKAFGGNGNEGNPDISAGANFSAIDDATYAGMAQFTTLTVPAGQTLTIDTGFAYIAVQGTCTIAGTVDADGRGRQPIDGNGGESSIGATGNQTAYAVIPSYAQEVLSVGGAGGGGHAAGTDTIWGGGGGGLGGSGKNGAVRTGGATPTWKTNLAKESVTSGNGLRHWLDASSGAAGGEIAGTANSAGAGGGVIYIECNTFDATGGTLTSDGTAAVATNSGGGGGGTIVVRCKTLVSAGTTTVTGGAGQGASAGAGADGFVLIYQI